MALDALSVAALRGVPGLVRAAELPEPPKPDRLRADPARRRPRTDTVPAPSARPAACRPCAVAMQAAMHPAAADRPADEDADVRAAGASEVLMIERPSPLEVKGSRSSQAHRLS